MAEKRRLLLEVEKTFKKIDEGISVFEDIWTRMHEANSENQREKFQDDLKREIKKLQKLRDSVKSWQMCSDVKDKDKLAMYRRLIETKMEAFKSIERENKTKPHSKQGLSAEEKLDPKEKAKTRAIEWLKEKIRCIGDAIDRTELEMEALTSTVVHRKRKNKDKDDNSKKMEELNKFKERLNYHTTNLEVCMRLVTNDDKDATEVYDTLGDAIDAYVNTIVPDGDGDPEDNDPHYLYEELGIVDFIPQLTGVTALSVDEKRDEYPQRLSSNNSPTDLSKHSTSSNAVMPDPVAPVVSISKKPAHGSSKSIVSTVTLTSASGDESQLAQPPLPPATADPVFSPPPPPSSVVASVAVPAPAPAPAPTSTAAASMPYSCVVAGNRESEPFSSTSPTKTHFAPVHAEEVELFEKPIPEEVEPTLSPAIESRNPFISIIQAITTAEDEFDKHLVPSPQSSLLPEVHVPISPFMAKTTELDVSPAAKSELTVVAENDYPPLTAAVADSPPNGPANNRLRTASYSSVSTGHFGVSGLHATPSPTVKPTQTVKPITERSPVTVNLPPNASADELLLRELASCKKALQADPIMFPAFYGLSPLGPAMVSPEQKQQMNRLQHAFENRLKKTYHEVQRPRLPNLPYDTFKAFPQSQSPIFQTMEYYMRLAPDTLLFIFYYLEGSKAQLMAAQALKKKAWRFHTKYLMWFQRHDEPKERTNDYEQGAYVYFDFERWTQKKKESFVFEYRYLEDRDFTNLLEDSPPS